MAESAAAVPPRGEGRTGLGAQAAASAPPEAPAKAAPEATPETPSARSERQVTPAGQALLEAVARGDMRPVD
eukprot:14805280-Alexandrium_andersonii.AAC.1